MARFFRFKSADDIVSTAKEMGFDIAMSDDFSPLFQPLEFGNCRAGNRLVIQPMEGCDGTLDGLPDELTYRRYVRFGDGGAKIIWGEATAIAENARMNPRQLWIHDGSSSALEEMFRQGREAHRASMGDDSDLAFGLQLTHSGRFSYRKPLIATHDEVLDPLTMDKSVGKFIDESYPLLSDDDLKQIEDQYIEATRLAVKIGVDFVDIKQCHRYLLSELLASKNREGEYGGSLENRTRLFRNVVSRIRDEFPKLTIVTRLNAYDSIPYRGKGEGEDFIGHPCPHSLPLKTAFGTDPNDHLKEDLFEPLQLMTLLKEWGVSLVNISMGNPYANPHVVRPADYPPIDGYHSPEHPLVGIDRHFRIAAAMQAAEPELPVVGSGYSWLQDFSMHAAAANVANGSVAAVGLGRATLSHPDFARSLQRGGKMIRKQICRTFSYCTNLMRTKDHPLGQYATGCPPFDKEVYGPLWKEAEPKLTGKK